MNKVLTISYYADFSRFFSNVHELSDVGYEHINLCIYPSAYVYDLFNLKTTGYLPNLVKKASKQKPIGIPNFSYEKCLSYYGYVDKELVCRFNQYLNFYLSYLKNKRPTLIILSGDSRLPIVTCAIIAKHLNIKVLYFEQGPLNTTIIDEVGVNANCSFRKENSTSKNAIPLHAIKNDKPKKWTGYKKYRAVDYFLSKIIGYNPVEHRGDRTEFLISNKKISKGCVAERVSRKPYVLLILQVPEDANMRIHSPIFSSHYDMVRSVHINLPDGYELVVREHPLYKFKYEKELYSYIDDGDNIYIDDGSSLESSISLSALVVTNNSTVGMEALHMSKSILVLGDSYYDNPNFVYKYIGGDLSLDIKNAISSPICSSLVAERLNFLFSENFIRGHFRDLELERHSSVSRKIDEFIVQNKMDL